MAYMTTRELPYVVFADDYHELDAIRRYLQQLVPGIVVKETGLNQNTGLYEAVVRKP